MDEINRIEDEIDTIESDIEERKQAKAESEGAIKTYMKQLKDSYDIDSEEELDKFIADSKAEKNTLGKKIKSLYEDIVERYERATS